MCAPVGNTKQLSNTFNELRFSLLLPADLPKGRYEVQLNISGGYSIIIIMAGVSIIKCPTVRLSSYLLQIL